MFRSRKSFKKGEVPGDTARVCQKVEVLSVDDGYGIYNKEVRREVPAIRANLVTSTMRHDRKRHAPVLDIDVPHLVVDSSTPGHSHIYIDVPMSWWRYRMLLRQMWKCGIIEEGYYKASVRRKHTSVRLPWVDK
jgi:hypothetical protein